MNIQELRQKLTEQPCEVVFTKKDGSLRTMICTTNSAYLPERTSEEVVQTPSETIVTVWDLEADGWRSFRFDSVKEVEYDDESGNIRRERFQ